MVSHDDRRLILGITNWRDRQKFFGIGASDRLHHMYVIGQTGAGKSTLLVNLMRQDAASRRGFAFLDPHGDAVASLLERFSQGYGGKFTYFDPADTTKTLAYNPLEAIPPELRGVATSGIIEALRNVWGRWWGPSLEHFLRNALLTLLEQPEATLADVLRIFADEGYRRAAVSRVSHPVVRSFWVDEFARMSVMSRTTALGPLRNKLGALLSEPSLFRVLTGQRSSFRLRETMDGGRVLLVNLGKGRLGSDASSLLGSLLVTGIALAALSRADVPEERRRHFFVFLDEFQTFTTLSVATMLAELRKYGVGVVVSHQYLGQLEPEVRDAILGNVGTMLAFRIGPADAGIIERYYAPELSALDLMRLPNHHLYVRLMVSGEVVPPFSAVTVPPAKSWTAQSGSRR